MNLDWNLFLALNQLAGQSPLADALAQFFAEYAILLFAGLLLVLWFLPAPTQVRRARQRQSINAVIALAGALLAAHFIGVTFYRARPFVAHTVTQLIPHPPDASFPSDHTTFVFTLIVALWFSLGRTRWFWVAWGILIGVARIIVGVHYPTDVLGGAILGAVWGVVALVIAPALARSESPLLERLARWRLA